MRKINFVLIVLVFSIGISSCSFEKRIYRNGFYVNDFGFQKSKSSSQEKLVIQTKIIDTLASNGDLIHVVETGNQVIFSSKNEIIKIVVKSHFNRSLKIKSRDVQQHLYAGKKPFEPKTDSSKREKITFGILGLVFLIGAAILFLLTWASSIVFLLLLLGIISAICFFLPENKSKKSKGVDTTSGNKKPKTTTTDKVINGVGLGIIIAVALAILIFVGAILFIFFNN